MPFRVWQPVGEQVSTVPLPSGSCRGFQCPAAVPEVGSRAQGCSVSADQSAAAVLVPWSPQSQAERVLLPREGPVLLLATSVKSGLCPRGSAVCQAEIRRVPSSVGAALPRRDPEAQRHSSLT